MKNSIFYKWFINILGSILVFLFPKKAQKLTQKGMTLVLANNLSIIERLMRNAIFMKIKKEGDNETLVKFHNNYWKNQGHVFFSETNNKLEDVALPQLGFIFDLLEEELDKTSDQFKTLVEIGTGNGIVLDYLSTKFPKLERLVGIDLSLVQTKKNKERYKENPKLEFVASDAFDWINTHGHDHMVIITFNGVLEYFTQKRLEQLFSKLNNFMKIIFVAIEPKSVDHDFATNPNSNTYGHEYSFSHNYPKLFEDAGFNLWHLSQKDFHSDTFVINFVGVKNY